MKELYTLKKVGYEMQINDLKTYEEEWTSEEKQRYNFLKEELRDLENIYEVLKNEH